MSSSEAYRAAFVIPRHRSRLLPTFQSNELQNIPQQSPERKDHHFFALRAAGSNNREEDGSDDDDEGGGDDDDSEEVRRKRDRLKDWFSSSGKSSDSPMVRPIRMQDGSVIEPEEEQERPRRVKAKFDSLFAGMPSVGEILGSSDDSTEENNDDKSSSSSSNNSLEDDIAESAKFQQRRVDESWFDAEKQQIMDGYEDVLQNMLADLEQLRQQDPESVPENAEAMIKSVLKQEMDREIESTKEARAQAQLQAYEREQRAEAEMRDISGPPDEKVQELMQKSEEEYAQQEASKARVEEFLRYEQEAFQRATEESAQVSSPAEGQDLDEWVLSRLKSVVAKQQDEDDEGTILDIVEENLEDLRERMEKESRRGSIRPETMKEWQMYRSIATRLTEGDVNVKESDIEDEILEQLESWKDYERKEEGFRKDSGLSRGPKLPFDWQEAKLDAARIQSDTTSPPPDLHTKVEARKEINRKSVEALESLVKTTDPQRRQKLQEEIDFLKATLEGNDYLDVDEAYLEAEEPITGPIDVSDVFSTSVFDEVETSSLFEPEPGAPSTPLFEQTSDSKDEYESPQTKAPPPSTPFFTDTSSDEEATVTTNSKLGSIEDQKLEAMYRRAGAKTAEERRSIKKQWEEFQDIERQKREMSGLSGGDDSDLLSQTSLDYDMSEVVKGDGDIDADKILASIGPRPTRKKKSGTSSQRQKGESDETGTKGESTVGENEVISSMYRAASAMGGGRFKDDPDEDMRQKASFEEFIKKENEVRQSLDKPVEPPEGESLVDTNLDDVEYAEEVLSSLGPRPKPKRTRITDEGDFSDKGGVLASEDDDEDEDNEESGTEDIAFEDEQYQPDMPEWLRREKEDEKSGKPLRSKTFLGKDIDEVFDDTDFDKNTRQLHEYEQRRTGRERQMGIDISDVLGRTSDDYADYKYDNDYQRGRQENWGTVSFETRKKDLLDYTELEVLELNALMDHKNSVYATGVSEYMPRINKPFKAFGAIFRLEGVLVDLTGLQLKSWSEVADEYGFKPPTPDDVRRAAVTRPDIAVKEIFFWSDDFLLCRKVAMSHRKVFRKFFDAWVEGSGVEVPSAGEPEQEKGSMALGQELVEETPTPRRVVAPRSEGERVHSAGIAWAKTAEELEKRPPTETEILYAELLTPDIAVVRVLRWSSDPVEVDRIVRVYEEYYADPDREIRKAEPTDTASAEVPASSGKLPLSQNEMMEVHFQAWNVVAETFGFDPPLPEEAMAAFVINDPLITIRDGFGWTDDSDIIAAAVNKFEEALSELLQTEQSSQIKETEEAESSSEVQPLGPNADDLYQASFEAWSAVAAKSGFDPPDEEQIQFALSVGPEEAVITGFQWTNDAQVAEELVEAYRMELAGKRTQWVSSDTLDNTVPPRPVKNVTPSNIGPSADDIYQAAFDAWSETARRQGYEKPDDEQVQFALSVGPEEAVVTGFQWTDDPAKVAEVVEVYKEELSQRRSAWSSFDASQKDDLKARERFRDSLHDIVVLPGAAKWVKSLIDVEMLCGVISFMERDQVDVLLQHAGLAELFPPDKRVSANNGYNRESQQMLGAALRLEIRPDHCVVFDTTPYSAAAAHDVEMRSVGLIGPFPRFELLSADSTSNSFEDLTAMNIRRLFGERVYDQTMLDIQQADPQRRQRTKTKYFWDDD